MSSDPWPHGSQVIFCRLPLMLSRSRNSTLAAPLPALNQGLLPGLPQTLLLRKNVSLSFSVADTDPATLDGLLLPSSNWGLSFPNEGQRSTGNASIRSDAYTPTMPPTPMKKSSFLTFDAGYEKRQHASHPGGPEETSSSGHLFCGRKFSFYRPDLVKQMIADGHTVGNHTWSHPDMSKISTQEAFSKELSQVEDLYREITGQEMTRYYRPLRAYTASPISRWQRISATKPSSGASPM